MVRRSTGGGGGFASLKRILGALVVVGIVGFIVVYQVNFLIGRSLQIAFGDAESTYRGAWLEWDGDLVAKDLRVYPESSENKDYVLRFQTVHLETPGWWWFVSNSFSRKRLLAKMDRLHLTLGGFRSDLGIDPSLGDLGPIGGTSASPFEAYGCREDYLWTFDELGAMGLDAGRAVLEFDYRIEGDRLSTTVRLDSPGVSTAILERSERFEGELNLVVLDQMQTTVESERWYVDDHGFVAARNAYCAKKDGTDPATFVGRHVDSVVRMLATGGFAPDAESVAAYRRFAAEGGELSFGGSYMKPIPIETLYEMYDSGETLDLMSGTLEHGGRKIAVRWTKIGPRPLEGLDTLPVYAALERERGIVPPSAATTAPVAAATPSAPAADATSSVPVATPSTTTAPTAKAPAAVAPGGELSWGALPKYVGHTIRVWTMQGGAKQVVLHRADGSELQVEAMIGGGSARITIRRDAFVRAELVD